VWRRSAPKGNKEMNTEFTVLLQLLLVIAILFTGFAGLSGLVYFAWSLLALTALVSPPTIGYSAAVAGVLWFIWLVSRFMAK
jgi:hypothetical protein